MITKKPRSKKAAKTVARTVRRATRRKITIPRAKRSAAKGNAATRKTARKPGARLKAGAKRTATAPSSRKRAVRRPKTMPALVLPETEPAAVPAAADSGPEAAAAAEAQPKVAGKQSAARPGKKPAPPEPDLRIPPILLEGDQPALPAAGPGQKYALGPVPPAGPAVREAGELPEAYGTGKLWLVARDPHWLYAQWDLTQPQQRRHNALSADRHLVVRVRPGTSAGHPSSEVHVHPESRHWFIHVERAATQYVAELGYYRPDRKWVTVATAGPTLTPPDTISPDRTLRFATIPVNVRLAQLAARAKPTVPADLPPLEAARERALAELASRRVVRREGAGSAETAELVRGRAEQEVSAGQLAFPGPLGGEAQSVSSPMAAAEPRPKGFWLNLNAELVLYGAAEPDASVTVGGRPIQLRPDGAFSFRFALPDGEYAVTVSALSAQGDLRQAELKFSRRTEQRGEVGAVPQDRFLKPPSAQKP
jgi:hypothetical protein